MTGMQRDMANAAVLSQALDAASLRAGSNDVHDVAGDAHKHCPPCKQVVIVVLSKRGRGGGGCEPTVRNQVSHEYEEAPGDPCGNLSAGTHKA